MHSAIQSQRNGEKMASKKYSKSPIKKRLYQEAIQCHCFLDHLKIRSRKESLDDIGSLMLNGKVKMEGAVRLKSCLL